METRTRPEDVFLITDKNKETCLHVPVPKQNRVQIVADFHVNVDVTNVPERYIVTEIHTRGITCNATVVFFKAIPVTDSCHSKRADGVLDEKMTPMPVSNSCYYKLPVDCSLGYVCEFDGFIAVNTTAAVTMEVCDVQQG